GRQRIPALPPQTSHSRHPYSLDSLPTPNLGGATIRLFEPVAACPARRGRTCTRWRLVARSRRKAALTRAVRLALLKTRRRGRASETGCLAAAALLGTGTVPRLAEAALCLLTAAEAARRGRCTTTKTAARLGLCGR